VGQDRSGGGPAPTLGVIEGLVLRPGARDVAPLAVPVLGSLAGLGRRLLAARTADGARLGLVTGAYMAWADPPAAETDGPVGVAVLAKLCEALGVPATVITDDPCADVVRACLDHVQARAELRAVPASATPEEVHRAGGGWGCTHLLAVERLGPAADGRVYTMRGLDNTAVTAPLHVLFTQPGVATAGIGDGGNEIGMGVLPVDLVAGSIPKGEAIACTVPVDHLIVAGTSNWGCYGLAATLAVLDPTCAPAVAALVDPKLDAGLIQAATAVGAVDGVQGEAQPSVDGVSLGAYAPLLNALRSIILVEVSRGRS